MRRRKQIKLKQPRRRQRLKLLKKLGKPLKLEKRRKEERSKNRKKERGKLRNRD